MFLARALSSWSQELEMKIGLRLNEENWVALAACVTLCGFGPDKARRS